MNLARRSFLKTMCAAPPITLSAVTALGEPQTAVVPGTAAEPLRIGLMQAFAYGHDQQKNLEKADALCREAAAAGADLLVMPEMWNIGYLGFGQFDQATADAWRVNAIPKEGPWVSHFRELAESLRMAIAVTYLQAWEGGPRNTVTLFDRYGVEVLTYAKVHTCDFAFEATMTPGEGWSVETLDTAKGPVQTGAMICFDREFPESARTLMTRGAELVITPNACLLDDLRIAQFRVRAYENAMAMVMANYAAPMLNGRSVAFDAEANPLVEADEQEKVVLVDLDLAMLRAHRARTLWGDAWRKPSAYDDLSNPQQPAEFKRRDAFGSAARGRS